MLSETFAPGGGWGPPHEPHDWDLFEWLWKKLEDIFYISLLLFFWWPDDFLTKNPRTGTLIRGWWGCITTISLLLVLIVGAVYGWSWGIFGLAVLTHFLPPIYDRLFG